MPSPPEGFRKLPSGRIQWRVMAFDNVGERCYGVLMARPRGHRLSPRAFDDVLRLSNLTITELAEISGVPRATLSGLAGGFYRASQTNATKIAVALGVHPETLFPTMSATVNEVEAAA